MARSESQPIDRFKRLQAGLWLTLGTLALCAALIGCPPNFSLKITTTSLPDGNVGAAYQQFLVSNNGGGPWGLRSDSGPLPDGLHLDGGIGAIEGTPTKAGSFPIIVIAGELDNGQCIVDQAGLPVDCDAAKLTIKIHPTNLTFGGVPATVTAGTSFNFTVTATDDSSPPKTVTAYADMVRISSTDGKAVLPNPNPANLTKGSGTFQMTLNTPSKTGWTITAADTTITTVTNTSSAILVTGPATQLVVTGPSATVSPGQAFDFTVAAQDVNGNTATDYAGTVHFTSSDPDPQVKLPVDYTFKAAGSGTAADAGMHTFSKGATLFTSGNQTITATDTLKSAITGTANISVSGRLTTTAISFSIPAVQVGGQTVLTATVKDTSPPPASNPLGTVEFQDSGPDTFPPGFCTLSPLNPPGDTSTCTLTVTAAAPAGSHTINATYKPTDNIHSQINTPGTATLNVTDFSLSASQPNPSSIPAGHSTEYTVTVNPLPSSGISFTGTVDFTTTKVTGLPSGASPAFNPTSVTFPGTTTSTIMTISTTAATPTGTFNQITLTGASGTLSHTATVSLTVNAPLRATTTTLQYSAGPPPYLLVGGTTTITATVTDSDPSGTPSSPTGTVSFKDTGNSDQFTSPCTLMNPAGTANSCDVTITTWLPIGMHNLTAAYNPDTPDTVHDTSTSASFPLPVVELVSENVSGNGSGGDMTSMGPLSVGESADGSHLYVAFVSQAKNLPTKSPSDQGNTPVNVFVRDTNCLPANPPPACTPTEEASLDPSTAEDGYGDVSTSLTGSTNIAADGSIVVWNTPGSSSGVLTRDLCVVVTGTTCSTTIQSYSPQSTQINGVHGVISRNGRYIAFKAVGSSWDGRILVLPTCPGQPCTSNPQLVNYDNNGNASAKPGLPAAVSDDGRFVLFDDSSSTMPGANGKDQLYIRDMSVTPVTNSPNQKLVYLVSCDNTAPNCVAALYGVWAGDSSTASMSQDGRFVSFAATADLTNQGFLVFTKVFIRDTCLGAPAPSPCTPTTNLVAGDAEIQYTASNFSMDSSGRYVAYKSGFFGAEFGAWVDDTCLQFGTPPNLNPGAVPNCTPSTPPRGVPFGSVVSTLAISGDGKYVVGDAPVTSGSITQVLIGATPF